MAYFSFLPHRQWLKIQGADSKAFLNSLISNDLNKLTPGRALYGLLLTPQGRFLFDLFIYEENDVLWVESERVAELSKRLSLYKLRRQVILETTQEFTVAVWGDDWQTFVPGSTSAFPDPRLGQLGGRMRGSKENHPLLAPSLIEKPFSEWDAYRLSLGVPDGSRDLVPEKTFVLEANFAELQAIDWQKGCYVGQELVARTYYRGVVRKRLLPVKGEGALPPVGTPIIQEGKVIGELRSSAYGVGLALLRLEALEQQSPLKAGEVVVVPFVPSWLTLP